MGKAPEPIMTSTIDKPFHYRARTSAGEVVEGVIRAASAVEAGKMLRKDGKFVVKLDEAGGDEEDADLKPAGRRRITRDEVIYFAHQMAVMVDTGVTLGEALESAAEQATNPTFRAVLQDVNDTVQGGEPFSDALAKHPKVFPRLMVSLLRASESSGTMGPMLDRISKYLTKERNTIQAVRGAMIYPVIMMIAAIGVTVFLLAVVLPRFGSIYDQRGADLPAPTELMLGASAAFTTWWHLFLGAAAALVVAWLLIRRRPTVRARLDRIKLRTPVIGSLLQQLYLARATRTMGTMIAAGVPMLELIAMTREVTSNHEYENLWDRVDAGLREGRQLSETLDDPRLIPPPVIRMIQAGEKGGRLGSVMDKLAEFTEHDFDDAVKRATGLIEPAMVVFMGGLIGFVAISMLLPIFSVGRVASGG